MDGWRIEKLPWVVGVRGLLMKASTQHVLDSLAVPRKSWDGIIEGAAIASAKDFYFLHQVRRKALPRHRGNPANSLRRKFDADDPGRSCNSKKKGKSDEDYTRHAGSGSTWKETLGKDADGRGRKAAMS